jgi:hypothetical protein
MREDIWFCFHSTHCWGFGLTPQEAFNAAKMENDGISEEDCELRVLQTNPRSHYSRCRSTDSGD